MVFSLATRPPESATWTRNRLQIEGVDKVTLRQCRHTLTAPSLRGDIIPCLRYRSMPPFSWTCIWKMRARSSIGKVRMGASRDFARCNFVLRSALRMSIVFNYSLKILGLGSITLKFRPAFLKQAFDFRSLTWG